MGVLTAIPGGLVSWTVDVNRWARFNPEARNHHNIALLSPLIMTDNPSFVLRGIDDVVYEERAIPDSASAP